MSSAKKNDASNSAGSTAASTSSVVAREADLFRLLVLELPPPDHRAAAARWGGHQSRVSSASNAAGSLTQGRNGDGSLDQLPRFILTEAAQFDDTCVDEIARPGGRFFKRV